MWVHEDLAKGGNESPRGTTGWGGIGQRRKGGEGRGEGEKGEEEKGEGGEKEERRERRGRVKLVSSRPIALIV